LCLPLFEGKTSRRQKLELDLCRKIKIFLVARSFGLVEVIETEPTERIEFQSVGFFRIAIWSAFSTIYGPHWLLVASTVGISLIGVVLWGTLSGSLLPFLLRRLGFDPAASSAPFVATLVDVTGLIIYFSVGLVILKGTLL